MKKFNNRDTYVSVGNGKREEYRNWKTARTKRERVVGVSKEEWKQKQKQKQKEKPTEKRQSGQCFTDTNASRVWKMISHCGVLCSLMKYDNLLLWIIFASCCCLLLEKLSGLLPVLTQFLDFFKNYTVLIK